MSTELDLYSAILARQSVRRYDREPLDAAQLARVREIIAGVQPLVPANRFEVLQRNAVAGEDLVEAFGGYGRIVTPPHYLVPHAAGQHRLVDLGYRAEQIAVRLAGMGVGSCYIGCLNREDAVRSHFGLPEDVRIGSFLIFGRPSTALGGRAVNVLMRRSTGATNKLPVERIFHRETFGDGAHPRPELAPLLEAARSAPSAVNAQPWRFLWRDGRLHLFVTRSNPRYGRELADYRYYDGGICMANVALALQALGRSGRWMLYEGTEPAIPEHPADLEPLAVLAI